jgi:hypothetical protein
MSTVLQKTRDGTVYKVNSSHSLQKTSVTSMSHFITLLVTNMNHQFLNLLLQIAQTPAIFMFPFPNTSTRTIELGFRNRQSGRKHFRFSAGSMKYFLNQIHNFHLSTSNSYVSIPYLIHFHLKKKTDFFNFCDTLYPQKLALTSLGQYSSLAD